MALSDEIKGVYDQLDAMVFAAEALQKCLADPYCYKPYHGSDAKEKVLEMQISINKAIQSLQSQLASMNDSMVTMASKAGLKQTEQE